MSRRAGERRPVQDVRIWSLQDRTGHPMAKRPWVVRWVIDGKRYSAAHGTKAQGDRYRSRLFVATHRRAHV